jgi:competence protein ComEC
MIANGSLARTILVSTLLLAGQPLAQERRPFERVKVVDGVYAFIDHDATRGFSAPQTKVERRTLDLYFIDVEGGAATLIITPAGESVLIDAGWDGFDGRDAKRIRQAMRQAGIMAIDHLVVTHYHKDHYGGVPGLARLVPIKNFYDYGKMTSLMDDPQFAERYGAYQAAAKGQAITLKPGDTIPLKTAAGAPPIKLLCVASRAAVISEGGAIANPACTPDAPDEDQSDNARSVALLLKLGDFEFLNLADLSWNVSKRLICPDNEIGEVDLYQTTHHGGNINNDPALLRSLRPTVAVMINGPRKGGHPDTVKWLRETPSFRALYQLHRNVQTSAEQNTPVEFIANLDEHPDEAHMITVSVDTVKSSFTVTNRRTKESRSYQFK